MLTSPTLEEIKNDNSVKPTSWHGYTCRFQFGKIDKARLLLWTGLLAIVNRVSIFAKFP